VVEDGRGEEGEKGRGRMRVGLEEFEGYQGQIQTLLKKQA
jgi:hypothetical protein